VVNPARPIVRVASHLLRATARSVWILAEVETADGLVGLGEASLHFSETLVDQAVRDLGEALVGRDVPAALKALGPVPCEDLVHISARCALDQALHDIEARRRGVPITRLFTDAPAPGLEVYANINRRTRDRAPEGFAASARHAVARGFSAVKIAPFDDVRPDLDALGAAPLLAAGFARMAAVREALGPGRPLLVDCHWRLSPRMLDPVLNACVASGVTWLETPYPEDMDRLADIRAARGAANALGISLAGGELNTGAEGFEPLIAAGCYDILMPDMKYVGGYRAFMVVSQAAARAGVLISPHNPTGPVCHAHSVQAAAAIHNFMILEMQFDETPQFEAIVEGDLPMPLDGRLTTPSGAGLSLRLLTDRLRPCA
jgi:galactonate dehydratase